MSLKSSILLFQGKNFRNCGPQKTLFCPEMENVNDLISYVYNYTEIETTNTTLKVTNLDDRYKSFVTRVIQIMGQKLHWVSIYNDVSHDILYNPFNAPKPRMIVDNSINEWGDITLPKYKRLDTNVKYKILDKFISHFKEDLYCNMLKNVDLTNIENKLYSSIMQKYFVAKITPCIPITTYIIDPRLVQLYPLKDRLLFFKKFYKELDNPHAYLTDLDINNVPVYILKYLAENYQPKVYNTSFSNMTSDKFKSLVNPVLQLQYLIKNKDYKSTDKWNNFYNLIDNSLIKRIDREIYDLHNNKRSSSSEKHTIIDRNQNRRVTTRNTTRRKSNNPLTEYDKLLQNTLNINQTLMNKGWNHMTTEELIQANTNTKIYLLKKFIKNFQDKKYCLLLQNLELSDLTDTDQVILNKILTKYIKIGLRPCLKIDNLLVEPDLFKLYPENDKLNYITLNYMHLQNPHEYLNHISDVNKIDKKILKFFANRTSSDFIKISWDNMTPTKFSKEINPYMQMEYLSKFGPNYYTTTKWQELYKAIDNKYHNVPEYKALQFQTDLRMNSKIKKCINTYSINQLVDMAIKQFGGNKNTYLKMGHDALCDLIEKKHFVIQNKQIKNNRFNDVSKYPPILQPQINYVDTLDNTTKNALRRYTHQFDWQVNQLLMLDNKDTVESLKHPRASDEFDVNQLEYGYEPILNKNIKDVQRRLDVAFANVPPLTNHLTVYRGVNYKRNSNYIHDPIYNKQYISTSTSVDVAKQFVDSGCCILYITVPIGSHVLPLERITEYINEYEVLLPRGGNIRVIKQIGNIVHAIFKEPKLDNLKPIHVFDEHVTSILVTLNAPDYVHSIIAGVLGPGQKRNDGSYTYKLNVTSIPFVMKKLPYIIMFKKLTKDYPNTKIQYIVITKSIKKGFRQYVYNIRDGHIFEDGKIIKFTGGVGGMVLNKKSTSSTNI